MVTQEVKDTTSKKEISLVGLKLNNQTKVIVKNEILFINQKLENEIKSMKTISENDVLFQDLKKNNNTIKNRFFRLIFPGKRIKIVKAFIILEYLIHIFIILN